MHGFTLVDIYTEHVQSYLCIVLLFNLVQNVQNSEHVQNLGGVQNFLNRRAGREGGMEQGGELSVRAKSSRWGAEDSSSGT